ncbi:phosphotransferase [Sphaerisporangium sp. NPDC088356]|uniref:phosphotransferase n=1 Tax=Sphaerisporangium sp. NPDC088356 TaxID=3154871 RepID=UPI00341EDE54
MHVGSLIASGRDCHIFEAGAGKVVRRARDGRNLEREASVMRHARRHGFPAPEVFDADGSDILMERVDGPNLMEDGLRQPSRMPSHGPLLAGLLGRLAAVRAPGWLPAAEGCAGNSLLHLDLHPLNVLITGEGPKVIDWANAGRGAPGADVACTWLAMATAPVAGPAEEAGRDVVLAAFLESVDREAARPYLRVLAGRRLADRYTQPDEKDGIDRLLAQETIERHEPVP